MRQLVEKVTAGGKHAPLDADFFEQPSHCMARLVRDIFWTEGFKDAIASGDLATMIAEVGWHAPEMLVHLVHLLDRLAHASLHGLLAGISKHSLVAFVAGRAF